MDALKEHQANSKISSGSLFWGPQSLFVPATTTTTTKKTTTKTTKTKGGCLRNWDSTDCTSILHPNQVARLLLHPFEVPVLHIRGLKVWGDLGGVPDPAVASHLLMPWYSRRRILIYRDMLSPFAFDMFIFCHALTVLTCVDPSLQDPGWSLGFVSQDTRVKHLLTPASNPTSLGFHFNHLQNLQTKWRFPEIGPLNHPF